MSRTRPDETAFVELSRTQPEAKAIVNQHLHAVGAFVDEEVGVMRTRFAKDIHDAGQRLVDTRTHVERLYRKPGRIDPDHLMSSRSSSAHSCAADAGHSTITVPPRRRTLMRIAASVGFDGSGTGTKFWPPSTARLDAELRIAMGIPLRSASFDPTTQHACVESACQGNGRYGYSRLLAFPNSFRLEKWAMAPATPTADTDRLFCSAHVYTYRA
jgi:hypothetical protein